MKSVKGKRTINKLIIILIIIVFVMGFFSNTSYAKSDWDDGGEYFDPIMKCVTFMCDAAMQFLQYTFVNNESIESGNTYNIQYSPAIIFSGTVKGLDINFINPNTDKENSNSDKTSVASDLQPIIATWYNALRRISLVGLLSVLLYIGIRILLTSIEGKENSKYKKMLIDWLVALCMLFTLHYMMNLILIVANKLSGIFNTGDTDFLLNDIRKKIDGSNSWIEGTSNVVMYIVLVVLTFKFTFQYLKRVLYMAFFTLIAPLITLTYPLDKIGDGKAQAFSMWLREYIFNALIQVIHLIIYYVLVGSASSLATTMPLYGIVAISFIVPAEKIIRKMFGFDNADTVGTLEAMAKGGLASKAMNGLKSFAKPPKGGKNSSSGGSTKGVRTATNKDVMSTVRNGGTTPQGQQGQTQTGQTQTVQAQMAQTQTGQHQINQTASATANQSKPKRSISGGAGSLLKKYHRKVFGTAIGIGTGATGAMLGFAAGVSQGDLGAALGGAVAGGKSGFNLGGRAYNGAFDTAGNIRTGIGNIGDTWNEGAYGQEYANNIRFDREFRRSNDYKELRKKYADSSDSNSKEMLDNNVQQMLEAGITDKSAMDKILKNVAGGNGYSMEDAMGYYALTKQCKDAGVYYDDKKLRQWLKDNNFGDINDLTSIRDHMKNF